MIYSFYRKQISAIFIAFSLVAIPNVFAEVESTHWLLEKDNSGIQIFLGKADKGTRLTYKAETQVKATLPQLFNALMDTSVTTEWLYNLKSIKLLESQAGYETYFYVVYSTPWPVKDVSAVLRATWSYEKDQGLLKNSTVSMTSEQYPSGEKYSDDGFMHIPLIETHNEFQQVDPENIKLTFEVTIDHGYLLPNLIVDTASVDALYETLKQLQGIDYKSYDENNRLSELEKIKGN